MAVFNSTKSGKIADINPNNLNLINAGTEILGEIISNGDIRIDGLLKGTINSKAKLVIGQTGMVEGDIRAQSIEISGQIKGNVTADDVLTLKASAKVHGDLISRKLIVENGAEFNGKCQMQTEKAPGNSSSASGQPIAQKA